MKYRQIYTFFTILNIVVSIACAATSYINPHIISSLGIKGVIYVPFTLNSTLIMARDLALDIFYTAIMAPLIVLPSAYVALLGMDVGYTMGLSAPIGVVIVKIFLLSLSIPFVTTLNALGLYLWVDYIRGRSRWLLREMILDAAVVGTIIVVLYPVAALWIAPATP